MEEGILEEEENALRTCEGLLTSVIMAGVWQGRGASKVGRYR
jgi:hypothetical protein